MNILMVKHSVERKPQYRQLTVITQDDMTGQKSAVKYPADARAKNHIISYCQKEELLNRLLKDGADIIIAPCQKVENDGVRFDYYDYPRLSDQLTRCSEEEYCGILKQFWEKLTEAFGIEPFVPSEQFHEMFGNEIPDGKYISLTVSNIDINFNNVFVTDNNQFILIDYEWVTQAPVPLAFLFFRSLVVESTFTQMDKDSQLRIFEAFDINETTLKCFWHMEYAFQHYVANDYDKLDTYREKLIEKEYTNVKIDELIYANQNYQQRTHELSVYKQAYDEQQKAIETLNQQRDEYKDAYDRQAETVKTLNQQRDEYKVAYDRQVEAIETLNKQRDEYKAAYDGQMEAIETLNKQRDEYKAAYDSQVEAIETLNKQRDEYKAAYDRQMEDVAVLSNQRDEYKKAYEELAELLNPRA